MRLLCTGVLVSALTLLSPRISSAQNRGSVNFVSGFSMNQGSSFADSFSSTMNLGGRVAWNVVPGFQAVGEVGRVGNVLPPLVSSIVALSPYAVRASALYGEGGVRAFAAPHSAVSPYVESTLGVAHLNLRIGGLSATQSDLVNIGLGLVSRTSPLAGIGGGVMFRAGRLTFDAGYRYKKIFARDFVSSLLGGGQSLNSQQVAFGVGVRF
jgi:hypothetical protein